MFFVLFLIMLPACHQHPEKKQFRHVIMDVDVSVDDMMSILYLLTCPEIRIEAITVVQGVSEVDTGAEIVLRLLQLTGHEKIPVATGADRPLEGNNLFPAEWQPPANEPFGLRLPESTLGPVSIPADSLMFQLINEYNGRISVLALGPATNIASCFLKFPGTAGKVDQIIVSDGAVFVEGAIKKEYPEINNTVSGWNQWVDPKAAGIVFNSGAKIRLVPLDLTALHSPDAILLDQNSVNEFNLHACNAEGNAMMDLMTAWLDFYHVEGESGTGSKVPIWDLVASMVFTHPEIATEWKDCRVDINMGTPETDGQILTGESDHGMVRIYLEGNQEMFDSLLIKAACSKSTSGIE
jgi:inosine-uridine nucleoside N-ribohydrolase